MSKKGHQRGSGLKSFLPRGSVTLISATGRTAEARRNGYAHALEESLLGEIVIGSAVLDPLGQPVGAIHIAGSLSEWDERGFRRRFAPLLLEAARALSG